MWWHTPKIPPFQQLRQENSKFKTTLYYILRFLENQKENQSELKPDVATEKKLPIIKGMWTSDLDNVCKF